MIEAPITIEPMQAKYNRQVGRLLVQGFREKFHRLAKKMNDEELSHFFETMLEAFPDESAGHRVIALQQGVVLGTLSMKWRSAAATSAKPEKQQQPAPTGRSFRQFGQFGLWTVFKLGVGLYLLDHQPQPGECYIDGPGRSPRLPEQRNRKAASAAGAACSGIGTGANPAKFVRLGAKSPRQGTLRAILLPRPVAGISSPVAFSV